MPNDINQDFVCLTVSQEIHSNVCTVYVYCLRSCCPGTGSHSLPILLIVSGISCPIHAPYYVWMLRYSIISLSPSLSLFLSLSLSVYLSLSLSISLFLSLSLWVLLSLSFLSLSLCLSLSLSLCISLALCLSVSLSRTLSCSFSVSLQLFHVCHGPEIYST